MTSLQEVQALQILEDALAAPNGIVVEVSSNEPLPQLTHRAKGILYKLRRDKPAYSHLVIKLDPFYPDTQLWIYPGREELEESVEDSTEGTEGVDL